MNDSFLFHTALAGASTASAVLFFMQRGPMSSSAVADRSATADGQSRRRYAAACKNLNQKRLLQSEALRKAPSRRRSRDGRHRAGLITALKSTASAVLFLRNGVRCHHRRLPTGRQADGQSRRRYAAACKNLNQKKAFTKRSFAKSPVAAMQPRWPSSSWSDNRT